MTTPAKPPIVAFADVLFSLKTFTAAMVALFIALCFDLQNPYWAVTTVYIVSTPLSGASTSKAVYRLLGTAIGGTMTVILVPNLVNSPELLTFAISLWIAVCLAISLIDRTPRSYVFMLAGYTAALTGFPIVDTPDIAFTYCAARVIEIGVGIICAAVVSRVLFPKHVGPLLSERIEKWLKAVAALTADSLQRSETDRGLSSNLMALAAEAVDLKGFTTHVAYDTSNQRDAAGVARLLQRRMVVLLPIISALSEATLKLRQRDDVLPKLSAVLTEASTWMESGQPLTPDKREVLLGKLASAQTEAASVRHADRTVTEYLISRLRDLIQIWSDCHSLSEDLISGSRQKLRWDRFGPPKVWIKHNDYRMAIQSGLSAMLSTCLASAFWISSGWAQGGVAAMMAGVLCCIFSTMDDPIPAMKGFLIASLVAVVGSIIMEFALLSDVDGFVPMVAMLGLFLIPSGTLMARPKTAIAGLGFSMLVPTMITLQDRLNPDLESFANSNAAIIVGFVIACCSTALVRSVGAEWSARRLLQASYADIAVTASSTVLPLYDGLPHRMVDRLGLIAPRIAKLRPEVDFPRDEILRDVRDAFNVAEIKQHLSRLPKRYRNGTAVVMNAISDKYRKRRPDRREAVDEVIVTAIDVLLEDLFEANETHSVQVVRLALTGLRLSISSGVPVTAEPGIASVIAVQVRAA